MSHPYRIIVIGESWHGSDCTGLARGFRELGHAVDLIGSDQFRPAVDSSFTARATRRLNNRFYVSQFNQHILRQVDRIKPHFIVVFKGNFVRSETVHAIKQCGHWIANFYPDVSFLLHGSLDIEAFKFYDHIFTTKSYGIIDFKEQLGLSNTSLLQHGFDPAVHRPYRQKVKGTDISFIGTWSPIKQEYMQYLASNQPQAKLRIWGNLWERAKTFTHKDAIVGHGVIGDFYALAIGGSKINLGLLSEIRPGSSSGDQVTSRTFHIPASGGFLLHQRTSEVLQFYDEGTEIECFDSPEELVEKSRYYLTNEYDRQRVAAAGYRRCISENSLARRAEKIIQKFQSGSDQV